MGVYIVGAVKLGIRQGVSTQINRLVLACLAVLCLLLASGATALAAESSRWTAKVLPQPPESGNGHETYDVSCVQWDKCVAVGGNWSLDVHTRVTLAEIWDGKSWSAMTTPNPPGLDEGWQFGRYAVLSGVSCISASDCVAVGYYKGPAESVEPLAERWDGSEWSMTPVVTPGGAITGRLEGVSCASSTTCAAVGYFSNSSGIEETLAESWNGSKWTIQSTPNPPEASIRELVGVSCSKPTACTAVGFYETGSEVAKTLAESWNGSKWTIQATQDPPGTQASNWLRGVSCPSSTICMAVGLHLQKVGTQFIGSPLAERWDGSKWSPKVVPAPAVNEGSSLFSVSCASVNSCTAAGNYLTFNGSGSSAEVLGERWDGATWSSLGMVGLPDPPGWWHDRWLYGVSCAETEACIAVGSSLSAPPEGLSPYRAFAEHEITSPLASFAVNPGFPVTGQQVDFDASASNDPNGTVAGYTWDFGDGAHGDGQKSSHIYSAAGSYDVTLTVTDDDGQTGEVSHVVNVETRQPTKGDEDSHLQGTSSPSSSSNRFIIQRSVALCSGKIVLSLLAPGPGRFSAIATATFAGRKHAKREHSTQHRDGTCNPRRSITGFRYKRDHIRRSNHRFPYGNGSTATSTDGVARLMIAPRNRALRALGEGPLRVRISIAFKPFGGGSMAKRKIVVLQLGDPGRRRDRRLPGVHVSR